MKLSQPFHESASRFIGQLPSLRSLGLLMQVPQACTFSSGGGQIGRGRPHSHYSKSVLHPAELGLEMLTDS